MNEEDGVLAAEIETSVRVHVVVANLLEQRAALELAADHATDQAVGVAIIVVAVFERKRRARAEGQQAETAAPTLADRVAAAAAVDPEPLPRPDDQGGDATIRQSHIGHHTDHRPTLGALGGKRRLDRVLVLGTHRSRRGNGNHSQQRDHDRCELHDSIMSSHLT